MPEVYFTWVFEKNRTANLAPGICWNKMKSEVPERRRSEEKGSTSHPARQPWLTVYRAPQVLAQNLEYLAALWSDLDEKLSSRENICSLRKFVVFF